jgi:hypothetical protein
MSQPKHKMVQFFKTSIHPVDDSIGRETQMKFRVRTRRVFDPVDRVVKDLTDRVATTLWRELWARDRVTAEGGVGHE